MTFNYILCIRVPHIAGRACPTRLLLSQSMIAELYAELEEFGVDVIALKHAGLSEDALEILYFAITIMNLHRPRPATG